MHKGTKHIDKNYFLLSFDCNRGSRHIRTGRGRRGMGMGHGWRRRRRRGWGRGRGPGWRRGGNGHRGGHGRGMGLDTQGGLKHHRVYIHKLLNMYKNINRVLTYMPNGVKTITTSKDPKVVAAIQAHVLQMKRRMDHGAVVRRWDPFFRQLFRHYSQIKMVLKKRPDGIEVVETGKDPKVIAMIHAHAANVSAFIKKSWQEARRCHLFKQKQKQKATQ